MYVCMYVCMYVFTCVYTLHQHVGTHNDSEVGKVPLTAKLSVRILLAASMPAYLGSFPGKCSDDVSTSGGGISYDRRQMFTYAD
jgi:hypothetical protein